MKYNAINSSRLAVLQKKILIFSSAFFLMIISGCITNASQHLKNIEDTGDKLTVGVVQKEIKKGMSGAEVAIVLGSPNLVTKDKSGAETWIYDKMSTEFAYSKSKAGISSLIIGVSSIIGGASGSSSSSSGASKSSQRTLTVIIKFIKGEVSEYTYHASSF